MICMHYVESIQCTFFSTFPSTPPSFIYVAYSRVHSRNDLFCFASMQSRQGTGGCGKKESNSNKTDTVVGGLNRYEACYE